MLNWFQPHLPISRTNGKFYIYSQPNNDKVCLTTITKFSNRQIFKLGFFAPFALISRRNSAKN